MSSRAVHWDPRLDTNGDTDGGSVVGTMTATGEGSTIVLLVIWRRKRRVGRCSLPGIFAELGGDFIIDSHRRNEKIE
jgi:hypothetical protein